MGASSSPSPAKNAQPDEDVVEYEDICVHIPVQKQQAQPQQKRRKLDMRTTEDKIIEEMQKSAFKARPLDKKIFERKEGNNETKVKIAPTKIEGFKLSQSKSKKGAGQDNG